MAARKKVKAAAKRRKAPAKKAAARGRKTVRRAPARRKPAAPRRAPAKKGAVRRPVAGTARSAPRRGPAPRPTAPETPRAPAAPPGIRIGIVTHYFSHLSVAVVQLESARLRIGDTIHIRGHTTDFRQPVDSLQVDRQPVNEVGPEDDFGLRVIDHVREHDIVYKVV
jgi:hypothetical protein